MLSYQEVSEIDDELYQFHIRQNVYYQLAKEVITRESLIEDMQVPEGFDESGHHIVRGYLNDVMVALIDYQKGYRYSMEHDDKCVWIGLFLVDQSYQKKGIGTVMLQEFLDEFKNDCQRVQLACLENNYVGLAFWKKLGFSEIANSKYGDLPVIVMEKLI